MAIERWTALAITGLPLLALSGCSDKTAIGSGNKPPVVVSAREAGASGKEAGRSGAGAAAATTVAPKAEIKDWGTLKGRVVWTGSIPAARQLSVEKDDWCKEKPIFDEGLVVDEKTKGVRDVFVYVKNPAGIHPSLPKNAGAAKAADEKQFADLNKFPFAELKKRHDGKQFKLADVKANVLLDQLRCKYVPHSLAVQEGQNVLVLNHEPVAHNVKVASTNPRNEMNSLMPVDSFQVVQWVADPQPLAVSCSIHGWMTMIAMVFDHPYFAVTKDDGSFELKNVPAGKVTLIVRRGGVFFDALKGGKGTPRGVEIELNANETKALGENGEIKIGE